MFRNLDELEVGELFSLSVEDREKVIEIGVDLLFQEVMITAQINEMKPSILLSGALGNIEQQIKYHTDNDNFELSYYFTEIFWEANKRLEELRKDNGNVFL
jgi:prophage maintenance system killer protein